MRKGTKKTEGDEGKCEKERNRSGVGIQPTTTIIIVIIIRCNGCSLMKRASVGELPIRSESYSIHSFFLPLILIY
jgi:hypothetical protein